MAEARDEVDRIDGLADDVRKTEEALAKGREDAAALRGASEAAEEHVDAATTRNQEAHSRVRDLENGVGEQQRRLREQEIENRLLGLDAREKQLVHEVERAERVVQLTTSAQELSEEISRCERTLEEARSVLTESAAASERDQREIERLSQQACLARYLHAKQRLDEVDQALAAARASRAEASRLQATAAEIRGEVERWHAPSKERVDELRSVETELRIADEKLHVGLTVAFATQAAMELKVSIDGEEQTANTVAGERAEFEAQKDITLHISRVGDIEIRGGSRDLRDAARAALELWQRASQPVFTQAGCASIAELEALQDRVRAQLGEAQRIDSQAVAARARAEGLEALEKDRREASEQLSRAEASLTATLRDGKTVELLVQE